MSFSKKLSNILILILLVCVTLTPVIGVFTGWVLFAVTADKYKWFHPFQPKTEFKSKLFEWGVWFIFALIHTCLTLGPVLYFIRL